MSETERKSIVGHEMGLKQARSMFDFINVELYTNEKRYSVKQEDYYMWSERNQCMQKYEFTEALYYRDIEDYVNKGIVYVNKG